MMINKDKPNSESAHSELTRPRTLVSSSDTPPLLETTYSFGWRSFIYQNTRLITHDGEALGLGAQVAFIPSYSWGYFILGNTMEDFK